MSNKQYSTIAPFYDDIAIVSVNIVDLKSPDKPRTFYGAINKEGIEVVPPIYNIFWLFNEKKRVFVKMISGDSSMLMVR